MLRFCALMAPEYIMEMIPYTTLGGKEFPEYEYTTKVAKLAIIGVINPLPERVAFAMK